MKHKLYSLLLTALFGMAGMNAWGQDLSTTEIDGVTYYEIGSAADLVAFAGLVNGDADTETPGQYNANAILTEDITLTDVWENPIGIITGTDNGDIGPGAFTGIFDGQGHKIIGLDAESFGHGGLFGDANGATIKDFSIWGKLQVLGGHGSGVIGYPGNSTISGVHSYLEISVPDAGAAHVGGVVGSARGGNTITGCTFNGTMTIAAGNADCFGGVVGYGGDNILFCANYGTITFDEQGCYAGGITGYVNSTSYYIRGCLNMGSVVYNYPEDAEEAEQTPKYGSAIVGRLRNHDLAKITGNCWVEGSARGAGINDNGTDDLTQAFCFPLDIQPSGEVCYRLNGDQTTIGWYQTLGIDREPTLDATHAQVYMNGHKHCNGELYEGYTFTNEATEVIQDEHNMVGGVCDYCGFIDWDAVAGSMVLNEDGFYEIANGPQLMWFAKYVNNEHADANAVLTADIDLAKVVSGNTWTPIGTNSYTGTFDGKGFTITGFNVTSNGDHYGLFSKLTGGAVVKDFTIYGTLISLNQYVGVIGSAGGGTVNISDIHSYLNITCSKSRHAGILGFQSSTGTINIDRCIYSGTLDAGTTVGNLGGIVGLGQNNASAYINITDCLFDGTILDDGGSNAGGIVGYANKTKVTIKNCLSVGTIIAPSPSPFIGQLNASNSKWAGKNYYTTEGELVGVPGNGVTVSGPAPEETNAEQLASGEICWSLNEEQFLGSAWRQTLSDDGTGNPYPLPTGKGDYVYLFISGYNNINSENIGELISDLSASEKEFIEDEDLVAYQVLVDAFKAELESWESITDIEEFLAAYEASAELKESILKSAENYKKYKEACEAAALYIEDNNLEGEWTDFLTTYLEENLEPNNNYPNGSFEYIMEKRNLDDEAIIAEIAFVNQLLENAIAGGLTSGTEITRLLANSTFADGFEGWTVEADAGITMSYGGKKDIMPIARGGGNGAFDVSQSLAELPNGIYMMSAGAMFRPNTDYYSRFYAGQIYLNGTVNYAMVPGEDVLPEEDAEPGVNCIGVGSGDVEYVDDFVGSVPSNMNGASYAFNAGRYQNFTAAEVTDGNLTVGIRSLGTGMASDWMPFGGLHVYYIGTADEANDRLAEVLAGYAARAQVIIDFESGEDDEVASKPNMSESLKTQLAEAIEEIEGAADGVAKMELINKFSALFNEVYACRQAYIAMWNASNTAFDYATQFGDLGIISEEEFYKYEEKVYAAQDHYKDGDVSTEEALAIVEELNKIGQILPVEDGVYQLATAADLKIFSVIVNYIDPTAKAVLTDDIDMGEVVEFEPIGNANTPYTGVFDGQGHAITNFDYVATSDHNGLFGYINNALVKNFRISGTLTSDGWNYNGVVGQAEGTSVVSGIYSDMNVNVSNFKAHSGGIVGGCTTASKIMVENCEYAGTLTHSGAGDCQAGILGYTYAGGVRNCVFSGTIVGENSKYGGILGYCKIPGFQGVQNCLSVGKIIADENCTTAAAIIANWNGDATLNVKNNYYCMKEGTSGNVIAIGNKKQNCEAPVQVTPDQLASGEVCYKLNVDQSNLNWYQTLGEDTYPVPFDTHKIVYLAQDGTYTNNPSTTPDGSEENPFVVRSAADLCNLINQLVSGRMNYVVMEDDVDMAGVTDWTPLFNIPDQPNGYPYIDFDGKGHIIRNLTSNTTGQYDYCGLFGVLCGNVRNLGIENANVTCAGGTGIIAGYLGHSTYGKPCYIEKVWVTGKVTADGYCGGMFGNVADEAHIYNCYANVEVNGATDLTGGIIGRVRNRVEMVQVYAAGSINRGGGIIGGGFQDATPLGTYKHVAVWNNTTENFGPVRENEDLRMILYYDGTNFADLQSQVVAWDPYEWFCDMKEGSYPVLYDVADPVGIRNIQMAGQPASSSIFNLAGQRMSKMQKGINIVNGKKIFVK